MMPSNDCSAPIGSWIHGLVRFQPSFTDAEFEDGLEDGRALSLDDAVALALEAT